MDGFPHWRVGNFNWKRFNFSDFLRFLDIDPYPANSHFRLLSLSRIFSTFWAALKLSQIFSGFRSHGRTNFLFKSFSRADWSSANVCHSRTFIIFPENSHGPLLIRENTNSKRESGLKWDGPGLCLKWGGKRPSNYWISLWIPEFSKQRKQIFKLALITYKL